METAILIDTQGFQKIVKVKKKSPYVRLPTVVPIAIVGPRIAKAEVSIPSRTFHRVGNVGDIAVFEEREY